MNKDKYFSIYKKAHKNAVDLLKEAELLFEYKHFARAYVLAFTALEEISKSQFAADVATGFKEEAEFMKFYRKHDKKIERVKWAQVDASSFGYNLKWIGPEKDDVKELSPGEPTFIKRQHSMYVDIDFENDLVIEPKNEITEKDAEEIVHIVEIALRRIWEVTEHWGHQIGTKGFMK